MNFPNTKNEYYHAALLVIKMVEHYIKQAEDNNQVNEQYFLDFLDKLNELSVKY